MKRKVWSHKASDEFSATGGGSHENESAVALLLLLTRYKTGVGFSCWRMRMIWILLSEKASQTLISITCCVDGQTEAAYFISGYCICATCLWTAIYCTCSFEVYIQHVFEL